MYCANEVSITKLWNLLTLYENYIRQSVYFTILIAACILLLINLF